MKKFIIAVALFFATIVVAEAKTNPETKFQAAFSRIFLGIKKVEWKQTNDLYIGKFVQNGSHMRALFDAEGNLKATTRLLTTTKELPQQGLEKITEKYPGYGFTELIEMAREGEDNCYYARITDGQENLILKITQNGSISKFENGSQL